MIETETAQAVAAGRTYFHPSVRQLLRKVGAMPPLANGGIIQNSPEILAFLAQAEADTGIPQANISMCLALHEHTEELERLFHEKGIFEPEDLLLRLGVLREVK
jgi:hypothetical protein